MTFSKYFTLGAVLLSLLGVRAAVGADSASNLLAQAGSSSAPYGWRLQPADHWVATSPDSLTFDLAKRAPGTGTGGDNRAMRTVRLPQDHDGGLWRLSGWIRVEGGNHQRNALVVIAVQGGTGIREAVREFNVQTEWTYFERRMRLPEGIGEVTIHVNYNGRMGSAQLRDLSLAPDSATPAAFALQPVSSQYPWLEADRSYRLRGTVDKADGGAPIWADFDFPRLLLAAGVREPVDPSSVLVLALDGQGRSVRCPAAFDQASIASLSENYLRNGTLKWRAVQGAVAYEIYFNAAGPDGPSPLYLKEPLGLGELLMHDPDTIVPLWAGWPGVGIDAVDADGDGVTDLVLTSTDGGSMLARNIGTMEEPLFTPRSRNLSDYDLPVLSLGQQVRTDWAGNGSDATLSFNKKRAGGYTDGVTATVELRVDGATHTLRTADGLPVVIDDASWTHMTCADFDGDGLPDLVIGSSRDDLMVLLNRSGQGVGVVELATVPFGMYANRPQGSGSMSLKPTAFDWNGDGRPDLLLTEWSGECRLFINESEGGKLAFGAPQLLMQKGGQVTAADSPVPSVFDWDGDGVPDLLVGDVNGRLLFYRNSGTAKNPSWEAGELIRTRNGEPVLLTARSLGVDMPIQGPPEWNWGYLSVIASDLTGSGAPDLIVNDSLGRLSWFENTGKPGKPELSDEPKPFLWQGKPLITPWRNGPGVYDWSGDGYPELLVMNEEGNLVMLHLSRSQPGVIERIEPMLNSQGKPVVINHRTKPSGVGGRANITVGDFAGTGKPELIIGFSGYYEGGGAFYHGHNTGTADKPRFDIEILRVGGGRMVEWTGSDGNDQWHSGGPVLFDWNGDGKPDLIHGVESGRFAYYANDYLNVKTFPIFEALSFDALVDGRAVTLIDFRKQPPAGTAPLSYRKPTTPIQWLATESLLQKGASGPRFIRFTSPLATAPVQGDVRIEADAGTQGIASVRFYLNGEHIATESMAPYVAYGDFSTWDSRTVPNGRHELVAVATFMDGKTVVAKQMVIVDNPPAPRRR